MRKLKVRISGFTLVEVLVVITIVGILLAMSNYESVYNKYPTSRRGSLYSVDPYQPSRNTHPSGPANRYDRT